MRDDGIKVGALGSGIKRDQLPISVGEEYAYLEKRIDEGSLKIALKHTEGADEINTTQTTSTNAH
jgi:hypothetical protein